MNLFFTVSFIPLGVIFIEQHLPLRDFWIEFSVAIGFLACSFIFIQFLITARVQSISEEHGIDVTLNKHKLLGYIIFTLIVAHPLILFIHNPSLIVLLWPSNMPLRTLYGILSLLSLAFIMVLSIFRKKLKISYKVWRISHILLSIAVLFFTGLHIHEVHHYMGVLWKEIVWLLFAISLVGILVYVRIIKPILMLHRPWSIIDIFYQGANCWTIKLLPLNHKGFTYKAGQFAWIKLNKSPFLISDHPFSFSSSPTEGPILQFTIKAVGDFTKKIQSLPLNSLAYVDGPYGSFTLNETNTSGKIFLIAGGVGITPMVSLLKFLSDKKTLSSVTLIYAAKDDQQIIFLDELERISKTIKLQIVYILEEPSNKIAFQKGLISKELIQQYLNQKDNTVFYVCGPPKMNKAVIQILKSLKIKDKNICFENFDLV